MTCEEFWNRMPELGSAGEAAGQHLTECSVCSARLAAQLRLAGALRALSSELEPVGAPSHLEGRLVEAFRAAYPPKKMRRAWWEAPGLPWAAAATAAALLVFALWFSPKQRVQPPVTHRVAPAPVPGRVELATLTTEESEDGFIPLPNVPQSDPNDEVNVVRMELPGSAMLAMGLEVSPEEVSGTVEAEVMLGSDGLARAVRFME